MKKFFIFGMMGALALAFTACSSEEALAPNPTYDGNSVKAEFSLNLPGKFTRQTTAITQDGTDFRGINDLYIAPFATPQAKDSIPVKATDTKVGSIALGTITAFDHTNAQDKWYNEVEVPVGTNAFLVYAKPTANGTAAENGSLIMNANDPFADLSTLAFELDTIAKDFTFTATDGGGAIVKALNDLAAVTGVPFADGTEVAWSEIAATDNQLYAELFNIFKSLKAGSKTDVLAFLEDQLQPALISNTGDATNGIDVKLQDAIEDAIDAVEDAKDFTAEAGLPDGAAVLQFTGGKFSYVTDRFITGMGNTWGANIYTYPAELWYTANSGIRASNEIQSTNVGDKTWAAFIETLTSADKMVKPSTQSVALVYPLQYAVGNFETWVKFAEEFMVVTHDTLVVEGETPELNDTTITETKTIPVNKLTLTGILVGDQTNVDWQFKPIEGADAKVIYDTKLITTTFNGGENAEYLRAAQTLVCETVKDQVNIALEFKNEGEPFNGKEGIVPTGAKFYLIAPLKNAQEGDTYTKLTTGNKVNIFQQDFKTIARLTIKTLENTAYNTIPDLRSPELEFGLSVDLEWQAGYEFDITIGN